MLGTNGDSLGIRQLQQRIKELEEENKTLKELNVCVGCDNNPDYKSRIDKAIEELKTANNVDIDSDRLCEIIECAIHILEEGSEE
jgi:cell shape-determining protein MreC